MGSPSQQKRTAISIRPGGVTDDAIQAQLERILASPLFAQAEGLRCLLHHLVERTLQGRAPELKEYSVAVDVFERGESFDARTDAIVRVQASRLRGKLQQYYNGEGISDPVVIDLPKGSYVPAFQERQQAQNGVGQAKVSPRRTAAKLAVAATLLLVAGAGMWLLLSSLTSKPGAPSVVVLAFSNLSADPGQEYICEGFADEISNALGQVAGLRVIARGPASRFKTAGIPEIARRLNAGAVLQGSVRKAAGYLRITAQLVNGEDGSQLWSGTFERPGQDVYAIQDEIARAIVTTLRVRKAGKLALPGVKRYAGNAEAHELYLRALHESHGSPATIAQTMKLYKEALAKDPRFAAAQAGVAATYIRMVYSKVAAPRDVMPKASEAVERALQMDEGLPDAHIALAHVKYAFDWDWDGAEREYQRALELSPNSISARATYALLLARRGRSAEAAEQLERNRITDPLANEMTGIPIMVAFSSRQYDTVILRSQGILAGTQEQWFPPYYWLGRAYAAKSQFTQAAAALEKASLIKKDTGGGYGTLGFANAQAGHKARALELLAQATDRSRREYIPATNFVLLYLGLGERERALDWLEKSVEERDYGLAGLKVEPEFDPLRAEPRFQAVLRQLHLE